MSRNNTYNNRQRQRNNNGKGIPDRWLNYDAVGREVEGTRFVPFKTPLDARFFENMEREGLTDDDYFDVRTIVQFSRDAGRRIGIVIDLTNTDRYYNKKEWKDYDIEYKKLTCPGHEVNDREDIVVEFMQIVDEYMAGNPDDSLIGVHCTHGLNRTGYLICRYLIDKLGWTAAKAISQFEYNRGHPIERGHYKRSLHDAEQRIIQGEVPDEKEEDSKTIDSSDEPAVVVEKLETSAGEEIRIQA